MKLEIHGLTKQYADKTVLSIPEFSCSFSHCLALIGPSGGGKSTLLRLIGGLETPEAGSIRVDGAEVPRDGAGLLAHRRSIGTVFQAFNLFPHLNAVQNVTLPLVQVHKVPAAQAEQRAKELLERFGLTGQLENRPAELSGGQRQRVAIARAVAIRPRFLLLDEPTSALDPEITAEILTLLDELRKEERPLVLVTHEIGFARHAADHVAFLGDGKLVADDGTEKFFRNPATPAIASFLEKTTRFVGAREGNIVEGEKPNDGS